MSAVLVFDDRAEILFPISDILFARLLEGFALQGVERGDGIAAIRARHAVGGAAHLDFPRFLGMRLEIFDRAGFPAAGEVQGQNSRASQCSHHRSEEHTSELQSLMRISYAVFCLKKKKTIQLNKNTTITQKTLNFNTIIQNNSQAIA